MSSIVLQRVVVRMMYDPVFCAEVYAAPDVALTGLKLTSAECQWLIKPDRRAYHADPERARRALTALLDEYPVACALVVRKAADSTSLLLSFFATSHFHECVQTRGSLAAAFGDFLRSGALQKSDDGQVNHLAALEQAVAKVRRAAATEVPVARRGQVDESMDQRMVQDRQISESRLVQLTKALVPVRVPTATLFRYDDLLRRLRTCAAGVVHGVLDTNFVLPASSTRAAEGEFEWVLVEAANATSGPSLEIASDELGCLLASAEFPIPVEQLRQHAQDLGATAEEANDVVAELLETGQITVVSHA